VRDPRILNVLVERLKADPVDAGHCLAAYGDPAAIPAMREALAAMTGERWMSQSLGASIEDLEAGRAVEGEDDPFDLWSLYPEETDPRFDLLTTEETAQFLDSADAGNRFAAVSVLSEDGGTRYCNRLLRMAREDPNTRVRGMAWRALMDSWD